MAYPAFKHEPDDKRPNGAVRLWLSQRQWMAVLESTERSAREADNQDTLPIDNQRGQTRLPAPEDARCLIRLGNNTDQHGTYLVRLRDISASGLGFHSDQPFKPKTRCTVALRDEQGHGLVCAASVIWCKPLADELHDVGIQFDKPIDAYRFATDTPNDIPC